MTYARESDRPSYQYSPHSKEAVEAALKRQNLRVVGYWEPKPGEWFLGKTELQLCRWFGTQAGAHPCIIVEKRA